MQIAWLTGRTSSLARVRVSCGPQPFFVFPVTVPNKLYGTPGHKPSDVCTRSIVTHLLVSGSAPPTLATAHRRVHHCRRRSRGCGSRRRRSPCRLYATTTGAAWPPSLHWRKNGRKPPGAASPRRGGDARTARLVGLGSWISVPPPTTGGALICAQWLVSKYICLDLVVATPARRCYRHVRCRLRLALPTAPVNELEKRKRNINTNNQKRKRCDEIDSHAQKSRRQESSEAEAARDENEKGRHVRYPQPKGGCTVGERTNDSGGFKNTSNRSYEHTVMPCAKEFSHIPTPLSTYHCTAASSKCQQKGTNK